MKKTIISALTAIATLLPLTTFASTFAYVNVAGSIGAVEAANAVLALSASDIDFHSGVMFINSPLTMSSLLAVSGNTAVSTPSTVGIYQYVDVNGNISAVQASSAEQAILLAPNIAPGSGVMRVR